jgi:hypothetical protein
MQREIACGTGAGTKMQREIACGGFLPAAMMLFSQKKRTFGGCKQQYAVAQ